jgi:hypothetical protein
MGTPSGSSTCPAPPTRLPTTPPPYRSDCSFQTTKNRPFAAMPGFDSLPGSVEIGMPAGSRTAPDRPTRVP